MAVYTKISKEDILALSKKYSLGNIDTFSGIKQGIENTNYLLKSKKQKFILTIFEKRVTKKDIPFFMKLMDFLNKSKVICPKPLKHRGNKYHTLINKKSACIVSFLKGKDKKSLNNNDCFIVGKNIAKMHQNTTKAKLYRKNSMGINNLRNLIKNINFKLINLDKNLKNLISSNYNQIKKNWPQKLPSGIIHGDLFIDNIFFNKKKFSGFIDFYFSANDFFMYEIAICVNALCFDKKNKKFLLNKKKVTNLINGYETIKKISAKEKKSLNILCRGAALRYLLTRTYDFINTPKTALIKIKDPKEYYQKLQIHNKLNSFRDYIN
jgi:homoserine kinase type II